MLCLWLGRLEWAGEDAHLGILDALGHLGVREFLVNDDTLDETGVLDGTASLGNDLDQVEVNVTALKVGDVQHCLQSKVSVVVLARADDLGTEGGPCAGTELCVVILVDVELLLDLIDLANGDLASLVEAISDFERVNALLQKFLGLLENGAGKHNDTGGAVADLIILRGGELSQKSGSLMVDLLGI